MGRNMKTKNKTKIILCQLSIQGRFDALPPSLLSTVCFCWCHMTCPSAFCFCFFFTWLHWVSIPPGCSSCRCPVECRCGAPFIYLLPSPASWITRRLPRSAVAKKAAASSWLSSACKAILLGLFPCRCYFSHLSSLMAT